MVQASKPGSLHLHATALHNSVSNQPTAKALSTLMQLGKVLTIFMKFVKALTALHKAVVTFKQLDTVSALMKTPKEDTQDRRDRQEDREGEWPRQFRSERLRSARLVFKILCASLLNTLHVLVSLSTHLGVSLPILAW